MFKLLFFTAAMILLPLVTYWITLNYVFQGILSSFWGIATDDRV